MIEITSPMYCAECGVPVSDSSGHAQCPGAPVLLAAFVGPGGRVELHAKRQRASLLDPHSAESLEFFSAPGRRHQWTTESEALAGFERLRVEFNAQSVPRERFPSDFASARAAGRLGEGYEGEG